MKNDIKRLILTLLVCAGLVGGVAYGASFYPFSGGLSTGTGGLKSLTGVTDKDAGVVILNADATYGNAFLPFSLDESGGCGTEAAPVCIESGTAGRWWELNDVYGMNHYAFGTLPEFKLNDMDGAGTALADKHAGSLKANFTTTTEDSEVSDIYLTAYLAGTETNAVFYDGSATALLVHGHVVPDTVNSYTAGTALLPFTSVFIGGAATNNIQLTGTAASAKVVTLPGQTGTVTVAPTTTTANQHFVGTTTAGLGAWSTSTYADTYVQGGLLHNATANTVAALAPGAVGSFLMSNGASAALSYLAAGAANYMLVGAGVTTIPVWTASTGTGAPVLANTPTLVTPVIGAATGTSIALGADPGDTANSSVMLSNGAVISWEDATEATITHVDNVGLKFNLPITLSNDESISNVDDTEITFVGTEAISLDLDTGTANVVEWKNRTTSTTGVTTMSFAALNLATTGTILGAINVVVTTDGSESPTAAQMYGTMFIADHGTATSDTTYTLPAAATGMSACFYDNGGGTGGITIEIDGSDVIILNGTALTAGNTIDSPGVAGDGANGDFICIMAIDATNWITLGRSGTWVDGGAT